MTTNRKRHLKSEFARFQISSILFNFFFICQIKLAKFCGGGGGGGGGGGVESERTVSKFKKEKKIFVLCSLTPLSRRVKLVISMSKSCNDGKEM